MGRIDWMLPSSQYTFFPDGGLPVRGVLMPIDVAGCRYCSMRAFAAVAAVELADAAGAAPVAVVAPPPWAGAVEAPDELVLLSPPHAAAARTSDPMMAAMARRVGCLMLSSWSQVGSACDARPSRPGLREAPPFLCARGRPFPRPPPPLAPGRSGRALRRRAWPATVAAAPVPLSGPP